MDLKYYSMYGYYQTLSWQMLLLLHQDLDTVGQLRLARGTHDFTHALRHLGGGWHKTRVLDYWLFFLALMQAFSYSEMGKSLPMQNHTGTSWPHVGGMDKFTHCSYVVP